MKKSLLIAIILTSRMVASSQILFPCEINGCIAHWNFDSTTSSSFTNLHDITGNNHEATPYNIDVTTGFRDIPNHAGNFDGTSSWAEVQSDSALTPGEISIVSLVKFKDFNSALCQCSQIISKGYPYFVSGNYGQGVSDNSYDLDCNIYTPSHTQMISQCGSSLVSLTPGNYVQLNKWYLMVTTIGGGVIKQYQVLMDTSVKFSSISPIETLVGGYSTGTNSQNISIGKHLNPSYPYWMKGAIDELMLFNKVLSDIEILCIYEYLWSYPLSINYSNQTDSDFRINRQGESINVISNSSNFNVEILNTLGQAIYRIDNNYQTSNIDISNYANQILIVRITNNLDKKVTIQKL